jgi:hypothetical protein
VAQSWSRKKRQAAEQSSTRDAGYLVRQRCAAAWATALEACCFLGVAQTMDTTSSLLSTSHTPSVARKRNKSPGATRRCATSGSDTTPCRLRRWSPSDRAMARPGQSSSGSHTRGTDASSLSANTRPLQRLMRSASSATPTHTHTVRFNHPSIRPSTRISYDPIQRWIRRTHEARWASGRW